MAHFLLELDASCVIYMFPKWNHICLDVHVPNPYLSLDGLFPRIARIFHKYVNILVVHAKCHEVGTNAKCHEVGTKDRENPARYSH